MTAKARAAGTIVCLLVLTGFVLLLARPGLDPAKIKPVMLVAGAWITFVCAVLLVRKTAVRLAVGLILIGGIAVQVVALAGPPQNSSDLYRYLWDGRVQAAGIDPYLYAPADAGVAKLRDGFLWAAPGTVHDYDCVQSTKGSADPADDVVAGCTKINRATVPTVYPPVAEAYFFAVQLAAPADDSTTPMQGAAAGFAVLTTLILLFGLRRLGKDLRLAALWAWCPTVALEAGQNGHVDVVGVALTAAALLLLARARTDGRKMLGGVLIGLAIATKVTPVLVVPAVLRRGWFLICASAGAAIALVYAPHVMAVGSKIIGFLPGYLQQQGYSAGTGFAIIGLFVQGKAALVVAVLLLGAVALAILRYCDPAEPWRGGMLMTAAALTVCTPEYQWYAILLVMLVALDGRPEWLAIAAGGYLSNNGKLEVDGFVLHHAQAVGYGLGAALACALALGRYYLARRAESAGTLATGTLATGTLATGTLATGQLAAAGAGAGAATAAYYVTATDSLSAADAADRRDADRRDADRRDGAETVDRPVIEPTAVFSRSAITVSIGAGGVPDFITDDEADPADGPARNGPTRV